MLEVVLNKNEEIEKKEGFPWVYNNEVSAFIGEIKNGEVCKVLSFNKEFIGYGFLSTSSKIMVRFLSYNENEIFDENFYERRIRLALSHRQNLGFTNTYRLIFSEADFLPGLIVDKYGDYLCCQFLCLGMDKIKDLIIKLLIKVMNPKGIYERSDSPVRLKEDLEEVKGPLYGDFNPRVEVVENDIRFIVDLENGQKTGYFLDQKMNRDNLKYYAKDKTVLDCFSNVGGFALHAAKYGAKEVLACDISSLACKEILNNAKLNNFNQIHVECRDVFDILKKDENINKFDLIVLDPPAFTKSKETVKKAYFGYRSINIQAMKIIKSGGYLMSFSCSQHMTPDLFLNMIKEASILSKRTVQFLDFRIQSPDHPALINSNEQLYLKCVILRVI